MCSTTFTDYYFIFHFMTSLSLIILFHFMGPLFILVQFHYFYYHVVVFFKPPTHHINPSLVVERVAIASDCTTHGTVITVATLPQHSTVKCCILILVLL